nr:transposase [Actinomadura formosensis]
MRRAEGHARCGRCVWPRTVVQASIVHLLRSSFRCAARQDWDKIVKVLKPVYTVPDEDAALASAEVWGPSTGRS